jgi:hypothetical protein
MHAAFRHSPPDLGLGMLSFCLVSNVQKTLAEGACKLGAMKTLRPVTDNRVMSDFNCRSGGRAF